MNKRWRDSDKRGMKQQTDGKVNIPLVEIFRLHARLDFIAPIGILHCESVRLPESPCLCVHILKWFQYKTTTPRGHDDAL